MDFLTRTTSFFVSYYKQLKKENENRYTLHAFGTRAVALFSLNWHSCFAWFHHGSCKRNQHTFSLYKSTYEYCFEEEKTKERKKKGSVKYKRKRICAGSKSARNASVLECSIFVISVLPLILFIIFVRSLLALFFFPAT